MEFVTSGRRYNEALCLPLKTHFNFNLVTEIYKDKSVPAVSIMFSMGKVRLKPTEHERRQARLGVNLQKAAITFRKFKRQIFASDWILNH